MPAPKLAPPSPPPPPSRSPGGSTPDRPHVGLQQPSQKKNPSKPKRFFRRVRSAFQSFPIINHPCKMPIPHLHGNHIVGGGGGGGEKRMTGTLFGYRKSRVNLVIQENPRRLPLVVLELSIQTDKLLQDMGMGLVRIALECEKCQSDKVTKLMEEPIWSMYCNGRKMGYGVKREATEDDLNVMQTLHAVSMGAGVLPTHKDSSDGDLTYMRAFFERVTGSKDSETYYMMNPDGNTGPELSIFFVRI